MMVYNALRRTKSKYCWLSVSLICCHFAVEKIKLTYHHGIDQRSHINTDRESGADPSHNFQPIT